MEVDRQKRGQAIPWSSGIRKQQSGSMCCHRAEGISVTWAGIVVTWPGLLSHERAYNPVDSLRGDLLDLCRVVRLGGPERTLLFWERGGDRLFKRGKESILGCVKKLRFFFKSINNSHSIVEAAGSSIYLSHPRFCMFLDRFRGIHTYISQTTRPKSYLLYADGWRLLIGWLIHLWLVSFSLWWNYVHFLLLTYISYASLTHFCPILIAVCSLQSVSALEHKQNTVNCWPGSHFGQLCLLLYWWRAHLL